MKRRAFRRDGSFVTMIAHDAAVLAEAWRRAVLARFVRQGWLEEGAAAAMLAWPHSGFSANVGPRIEPEDRACVLRVARYGARAPVAESRLRDHAERAEVELVSDASDIAVAAEDARFGLSEVRLGILPALISPYVIRRLGDATARELMLTGERVDAAAALRLKLVHHVVPSVGLDAKVSERVDALLAGGPQAQTRIKQLLERWGEASWEEYRAALPRTLAEVRSGEEAREGLAAFSEKRKPGWQAGG